MHNHDPGTGPAEAFPGVAPDNPGLPGITDAPALGQLQTGATGGRASELLVAAYGRNTHRLLTDVADLLGASVAYVDRPTVEAHLERPLSDVEWSATVSHFTAMAFDEHVGDAGTLRSEWIEDVLRRADVAGRGQPVTGQPGAQRRPARP
jgi:hypothetical protein